MFRIGSFRNEIRFESGESLNNRLLPTMKIIRVYNDIWDRRGLGIRCICYNFPRLRLKGRLSRYDISLSLSQYHAHTLHQLRYPPNWFPITHLYTRMHPLWVIKRISFQVHARACSETFHRLHIIQKRIPFSSLVLNYSPTCKYSFSSNPAMFYRVLYDGQDRC